VNLNFPGRIFQKMVAPAKKGGCSGTSRPTGDPEQPPDHHNQGSKPLPDQLPAQDDLQQQDPHFIGCVPSFFSAAETKPETSIITARETAVKPIPSFLLMLDHPLSIVNQ